MGTDGYGEKSHGFDRIFLRTNPYKSVQIRTNPELWSDRPARKYRAARLNFSKPVAKERIEHP